MIRCVVCSGRIRPPNRAWAEAPGGVHFYDGREMLVYAAWLEALSKRVPFVHEECNDGTPGRVIALDLEARLKLLRRRL